MNNRFSDLFSFEVKPWMIYPFTCHIHFAHEQIQEQLIELECDEIVQNRCKRGEIMICGNQKAPKSSIHKCIPK